MMSWTQKEMLEASIQNWTRGVHWAGIHIQVDQKYTNNFICLEYQMKMTEILE